MLTLQDKRNGNIYLVGEIKGKEYLFNGVCRFDVTEERLQHLREIKPAQNVIDSIITRDKKQYPYDFKDIKFL